MLDLREEQLLRPGDSHYLGLVRIAFFTLMAYSAWSRNRSATYAKLYMCAPRMWKPISFYRLIDIPSVRTWLARRMGSLVPIWYVSIALAISGVFFPLGSLSACFLSLVVLGYQHQFGKIDHARGVLPLFALVLSCAPADALTVSPLFEIVPPDLGFSWPVTLAKVLVSCVWLGAGVSKLRHGRLEWVFSDNLSSLWRLHVMDYYFRPPLVPAITRWLARRPRLCQLGAATAVVVELFFPLALLGGVFALVLVPSSLLLLIGFRIIQGPRFLPLFVLTVLAWGHDAARALAHVLSVSG